jgi:hypothetical protein
VLEICCLKFNISVRLFVLLLFFNNVGCNVRNGSAFVELDNHIRAFPFPTSMRWKEAARSVALRWENAYGGHSLVRDAQGAVVLEAWFANPVGCGWWDSGWKRVLEKAGQGQN